MVAADSRHSPDAGARQAAQLRGQCDAARRVPYAIIEYVAGKKQRRHVLFDRGVDKARKRRAATLHAAAARARDLSRPEIRSGESR